MMIQGPIYPTYNLPQNRTLGLMEICDIQGSPPKERREIDLWIKANIHVAGKRDWIFIKTHTHGATDSDAVLGNEMDEICNYLETKYNDGKNFVLHYVTARELYNIIKAIEAGEPGTNPEQYKDYKIKPPIYDSSPNISEASEHLKKLIAKTYE